MLLAKDVGDVVGAERAGSMSFTDSGRYRLWPIFSNQSQQLADLSSQRAVGVGQAAQIEFTSWAQQGDQTLLSSRALRRRELGEQFFLKPLATDNLPTLPAAGVRNDFLVLVIDAYGGRVGLDGEMAADVARRYTVTIAVEGQP